MRGETEVVAGRTKTSAADIDAAQFCRKSGADEKKIECDKNCHRSGVKPAGNERETAKDFQPGQVKRQSHTERPRNNVIILDVTRETDRLDRLQDAGVDENSSNDKIEGPQNQSPL